MESQDRTMSDITEEQEEIHQQPPKQVEDEVTIDITTMIQDIGHGNLLPECCIYKVPPPIRNLKLEAYIPQVVSIGPFHHGNERLLDMERHKQIMFKRFTQRAMPSLDDLVSFVKHLEPKVRASYSEHINLTEQELVKLTLMDAGFIIELFIMFHVKDENIIKNDAKLSQSWLVSSLILDLLLLENQLPFFIIEELFNEALPPSADLPAFLVLTYEFFEFYNEQRLEPNPNIRIRHFTDLLRLFNLQREMPRRSSLFQEAGDHILLYSANALQEAGIKLKHSMSKCLLDLKFSGHILEIPNFFVEDNRTEILFRNMIALEQCHYYDASYITDYAFVLDCLINTNKDVDLLIHNNIVNNIVGDSNDVAILFNGLCQNVTNSEFNSQYLDICRRLNGFCQDPWNKMKATLRHDYCRTPWQIVASIAAIVLLILTLVQTICSILQVA